MQSNNLSRRRGKRYHSTRSVEECAKLIKEQIKAAFPGVRVYIHTEKYCNSDFIEICIRSVPFQVHSDAYLDAVHTKDFAAYERYKNDYVDMLLRQNNREECAENPDYTARGERLREQIYLLASEYRYTKENRET